MTDFSGGIGSHSFWSQFFLVHQGISGLIVIFIYISIISLIAFAFSDYVVPLYKDEDTPLRPYTSYIIGFFEKLIGPLSLKRMKFKEYFLNLLFFNFVAALAAFLFIYLLNSPGALSGRPLTVPEMVNTVVSFTTNTDMQHFPVAGHFPQFAIFFSILGLMVVAPVTGFAASMAFIRGIRTNEENIGNFYHDFLVALFDLFIPLTVLFTILFAIEGLPETLLSSVATNHFQASTARILPLGPVASFVSFSAVGTNGAAFYPSNSAFPLQNPSWFSNLTEIVAFTLVPLASIFSLGRVLGNKNFSRMLYGTVIFIYLFASVFTFYFELHGIPLYRNLGIHYTGNMIGKENAIGIAQSSVFNVGATISSAGLTNSALIGYTPGGIIGIMVGLMINDPLGGFGTSVINIFTFVIFTAFLASLMVGKLPELMGFKLGAKEIKYSTLSLITHPLVVLVPLGLVAVAFGALSIQGNPSPQTITELFYEFTSAASNNGSSIGGLPFGRPFFEYLESIIMILGRYLLLGFQLYIAQLFANRRPRSESPNTVKVGSPYFGLLLLAVIMAIGLLSYFPVLALGPFLSFARDLGLLLEVIPF